jgi:hypothetical protein
LLSGALRPAVRFCGSNGLPLTFILTICGKHSPGLRGNPAAAAHATDPVVSAIAQNVKSRRRIVERSRLSEGLGILLNMRGTRSRNLSDAVCQDRVNDGMQFKVPPTNLRPPESRFVALTRGKSIFNLL